MTNHTRGKSVSRALCCECGQLRTVSKNYWPKGKITTSDVAFGGRHDLGDDDSYWRFVEPLKCSNCGTQRNHAVLRDDEYADCEESDRVRSRPESHLLDSEEELEAATRDWIRKLERFTEIVDFTRDGGILGVVDDLVEFETVLDAERRARARYAKALMEVDASTPTGLL